MPVIPICGGPKECVDMRNILFAISLILMPFVSVAQDAELNRLVDIVTSLKSGGVSAFDKAVKSLAGDDLWTQLDEAVDRKAECPVSDVKERFGLNSALNNARSADRHQTSTGNHLNGADMRYNYSLYEKTLKAKSTATFNLAGRWGEQVVLIIPYDGAASCISATANDGMMVSDIGDGRIRITGSVNRGEALSLKVTNGSDANVSYVIINYNSRK